MSRPLQIGILAGESSGDILGAGLMQQLRLLHPSAEFSGIGGPLMIAEGLQSEVPMERLSVMGLVEPLKRLPELLRIRKNLVNKFIQQPPDVFIGIDSPEFNVGVELRLRQHGIKTVHYVSPSVWAWRQKRIHKIARAVDLMLTLLPFEASYYEQHQVPVCFVGHPLADLIPLQPDQEEARAQLGLAGQRKILAMLPGSRQGEVARLAPVFLSAASTLLEQHSDLTIVIPCANEHRMEQMQQLMQGNQHPRLLLLPGQSRAVMCAADAVILASGTAALEAMLLKKPMLVCYKLAPLSYFFISRMLKVPYFSLPNLLAGEALVEELVQEQVESTALASKINVLLTDSAKQQVLLHHYQQIHQQLRQNASHRAAEAILNIL